MNIYFYEDNTADQFDPVSLTRPLHAIRCGRKTFMEWNRDKLPADCHISIVVREELENITKELFPEYAVNPDVMEDGIWVLASAVLTKEEWHNLLQSKVCFFKHDKIVAQYRTADDSGQWWFDDDNLSATKNTDSDKAELHYPVPEYLWEILPLAHQLLQDEFAPGNLPVERDGVTFINKSNMTIDDTANILPQVILDASAGPIVIEENVKIFPFTYIQGPAVIGKDSQISSHTQYRNSYCGPMCKLGGEVSKTIIQGNSNKVHDGHLGDSFLGEWVNLGAGTTNSNLKNNYKPVSVSVRGKTVHTNTLFAGCYIGDHSKAAIGTQFNTGTVVGPGCNIVTSGFPPKTIRPFTWLINGKHRKTLLDKFVETAEISMKRRNQIFSIATKEMYKHIYENR